MSNYEIAPATKLLATQCCACGRPLLDSKSVELGIGPKCRKDLGFDLDVSDAARVAANAIVFRVAADQAMSATQAADLVALGFATLAAKLAERLSDAGTVEILDAGDSFLVTSPYSEAANVSWRNIAGRRWDRDAKANRIPKGQKGALWTVLCRHFAGAVLKSAKGTSVIPADPKAPRQAAQEPAAAPESAQEPQDTESVFRSKVDALCASNAAFSRLEAMSVVANSMAGRCPDGCCGPGADCDPTPESKAVDAVLRPIIRQARESARRFV